MPLFDQLFWQLKNKKPKQTKNKTKMKKYFGDIYCKHELSCNVHKITLSVILVGNLV